MRAAFVSAALAALAFSCSSLPSSTLSRQTLFSEYDKARPRISPDGKRIAYLARDRHRTTLWVRGFEKDDSKIIPLDFRADQTGIWTFFWQGDNRHILYFSDNQGDENFHLRQIDVESGETLDLTPFPGASCGLVAMEPSKPDELLIEANARDRHVFDLYRVEIGKGKVNLVAKNPGDVFHWIADRDLKLRAALFKEPRRGFAHVRLLEPGGSSPRAPPGWLEDLSVDHFHGLSSDGLRFWFSSDWKSDTRRLIEWDLQAGKPTVLATDPEFDVEDALLSSDFSRVDAAVINREIREWRALSPWMQTQLETLEPKLGKDFSLVSRDASDDRWILRRSADTRPASYFSYETRSRKLESLFEEYPQIPQAKLRPMKPVHFEARDGMIIYGYLTEPDRAPQDPPPPLVLLVHGGPWSRDSWGFDAEVQWLATRGYAVLQINFRGSSGFGDRYETRGRREWGRKMLFDLIDGKNWALANHLAAPGKVGLWGASYGGYATLAALTMAPDDFSCGVAVNGPADLESFMKTAPPHWKMSESFLFANIGDPGKDHAFLKERSPQSHAESLKAPLLVVHSANDSRVNRAQSDAFVARLRELKKPVSYLVLPEGGHTLQSQRYRSYLAAVEEFLGKCLGGVVEPPLWWERWGDLEN